MNNLDELFKEIDLYKSKIYELEKEKASILGRERGCIDSVQQTENKEFHRNNDLICLKDILELFEASEKSLDHILRKTLEIIRICLLTA